MTEQNSATEVHFRVDEPRKSVSFKCNLQLWKAFKTEIRRNSLSICHVLEPMIYGWLEGKVHLSNTLKPLRIENLIVERAVKRVRRYGVEVESDCSCHFCGKASIGSFRFKATGRVYGLCGFHAEAFVSSRGNWECIRDE